MFAGGALKALFLMWETAIFFIIICTRSHKYLIISAFNAILENLSPLYSVPMGDTDDTCGNNMESLWQLVRVSTGHFVLRGCSLTLSRKLSSCTESPAEKWRMLPGEMRLFSMTNIQQVWGKLSIWEIVSPTLSLPLRITSQFFCGVQCKRFSHRVELDLFNLSNFQHPPGRRISLGQFCRSTKHKRAAFEIFWKFCHLRLLWKFIPQSPKCRECWPFVNHPGRTSTPKGTG